MELQGWERHRWDQAERPNGAYGKIDIEGKTARKAASELGKERVSNERERVSQFVQQLPTSRIHAATRKVAIGFLRLPIRLFSVKPG